MGVKVTIVGKVKNIRENDNKIYTFLMKVETSKTFPKGLSNLGTSIYQINITEKVFNKVKNLIKDNEVIVTGEPKAAVSNDGTPFIAVNCFNIEMKPDKKVKSISTVNEAVAQGVPLVTISQPMSLQDKLHEKQPENESEFIIKEEETSSFNAAREMKRHYVKLWYEDLENVVILATKDILVTEKVHIHSKRDSIKLYTIFKNREIADPIAVRPLFGQPGKYTVVAGITRYYQAKILDIPSIPCFITNLSKNEFEKKYQIPFGMKSKHKRKK